LVSTKDKVTQYILLNSACMVGNITKHITSTRAWLCLPQTFKSLSQYRSWSSSAHCRLDTPITSSSLARTAQPASKIVHRVGQKVRCCKLK